MFVACSTLCFSKYPLERALRMISDLEFGKVDVAIHEHGSHLRPSEVAADVGMAATRLRMGPSLGPGAFSIEIDAPDPEAYRRQLRAVCHLARVCAVPIVTVAAAPAGTDMNAEVKRLTELNRLAEAEGVVLTIETRIGTLTEDPDAAVELCRRVPGLALTLDPSHYIAGPHQGKCFEQVYPYVRHVHLRDTGRDPGKFQVRVGQGEVEYGRIISYLSRHHYDRLLSVEMHDAANGAFDMEQEVRKLKYLLESMV